MRAYSFLILISLLSFAFSLIVKYGSDKTSKGIVVFESKDYIEGEDMYFKIEALRNAYSSTNYVRYYYMDINLDINYADFSSSNPYTYTVVFSSTEKYTKSKRKYERKYFIIKKQSVQFGSSTTGNYIVMQLPLDKGSSATVTSTKKDKEKLPTWAIAVIVVVIVIVVAVVIFGYILKRKKSQAVNNGSLMAPASFVAQTKEQKQAVQAQVYQNQVNQAQAQAYQAQAYQNQMYPNQMNQAQYQTQGYQSQMNQAQPYPQQNYQVPINSNDDVGYTSNAAVF